MASATMGRIGRIIWKLSESDIRANFPRKMTHLPPPTPVATANTAANSILNGTEKQKRSRKIDLCFYWVRDRI